MTFSNETKEKNSLPELLRTFYRRSMCIDLFCIQVPILQLILLFLYRMLHKAPKKTCQAET